PLGAAILVETLGVLVDVVLEHAADRLVLHHRADEYGRDREHRGQAKPEQDEREDDPAAQPPAVSPAAESFRRRRVALSLGHRARRSGSRCRGGSAPAAWGTACRSPRAGRGYGRAGCRNPAVPRPRPGFPAPGG